MMTKMYAITNYIKLYIISNFQQPPLVAMQYKELTEGIYFASLLNF